MLKGTVCNDDNQQCVPLSKVHCPRVQSIVQLQHASTVLVCYNAKCSSEILFAGSQSCIRANNIVLSSNAAVIFTLVVIMYVGLIRIRKSTQTELYSSICTERTMTVVLDLNTF